MGAFTRVVDNVNKIRFKNRLDKYDSDRYRYIISRVFARLDEYFTKTGYYDCNDYDHVVDRILVDREYQFELCRNLPVSVRGRFLRYSPFYNGLVKMNAHYFYENEQTEATLCHEVIHMLTTGCDTITYKTAKGEVELVLPDNYSLKAGYKKVTKNGKSKTEVLTYADVSHNGFFKEGLTEILRQKIYTLDEAKDSYPLQTSFVRLLNMITKTSEDKCIREFLQGDLETYRKYFGVDYRGLQLTLDKFMAEYKIIESFYDSEDLKKAYGIVIKYAFRDFAKTKPSAHDIFKFVDKLAENIYIFDSKTFYENSVVYATRIFRDTISEDADLVTKFKARYEKLIELKANSEWYKYAQNLHRGFRVTGLSEDIFFTPSRYSPMGALAIMYGDTIMSNFLIPKEVGAKSKLGGSNLNETPIEIHRPAEDTVVYTQGDTVRKVIIRDGKCFVFNENDKQIDGGYLSTSMNDDLKRQQYNLAVEGMDKFMYTCSISMVVEEPKVVENKPSYDVPDA